MYLKYIGYLIFALLVTIVCAYAFFYVKKRNKIKLGINKALKDGLDKSYENFNSIKEYIDEKVFPFLDNKAYQISQFKQYELVDFMKIESMYDTFVMFIDDCEEQSMVPFYISEREYKNIYIFMLEMMYSLKKRINAKVNKTTLEDAYLHITTFIEFHKIDLKSIYFIPVKSDIDITELNNLLFTKGFNSVSRPKNMFELRSKKLSLDINPPKFITDFKVMNKKLISFLEAIDAKEDTNIINEDQFIAVYTSVDTIKEEINDNFKIKLLFLNYHQITDLIAESNVEEIKKVFTKKFIEDSELMLPNPINNFLNYVNFDENVKIKIINKKENDFLKVAGDKQLLKRTVGI